jgi:hypothetical protein
VGEFGVELGFQLLELGNGEGCYVDCGLLDFWHKNWRDGRVDVL